MMEADRDDADEATHSFASSACFAHEVEGGQLDAAAQVQVERRAEIMAWRKGERARLIEERLAMPVDLRTEKTLAIAGHLDSTVGDVAGRVVSFYWPLRGEPNLRDWAEALAARGAITALPLVVERNTPLVFRTWRQGEKLVKGFWNIPVPEGGRKVVPDICLAPVVGHDARGFRLGYGGGYFDRTLASLPASVVAIGVGYAEAAIRTIHPLAHDIPLDAIVTDRGVQRYPSD